MFFLPLPLLVNKIGPETSNKPHQGYLREPYLLFWPGIQSIAGVYRSIKDLLGWRYNFIQIII